MTAKNAKEALTQKKAALQAEMARMEAELAALEAEREELVRQKAAQDAELAATKAEIAERDREAKRQQEQADFDKLLAELDAFFDDPEQKVETPPAVPEEKTVLWKQMDADTEWNFEQAVRDIMIGKPEYAVEWVQKVLSAGHPMAEQLRWTLDGELDKHSGQVHPFFLALDAYGKKRYAQAVSQFEKLAEQGCLDAMVALGYDAVYEMNGPVDLERAFAWRERAGVDKARVLAMIAVNIDTKRRLEKLEAELSDVFKTEDYTAEGAAAYHKGNYALAIQKWEAGWQHGEDSAAYNLSILYDCGKIPKNAQLLCLWSRRFADMTTDKEKLLKTAQRLYRNRGTTEAILTCADCALKLAKMGNSTMMVVFEDLLKRSRTAEEIERCIDYAKELIKIGQFKGVSLLTDATRALEAAREWQKPNTKYMEYVEAMEQLSGGRANKKLIATLEGCAEAGVGGAAFALFQIYSQGMGVREDPAQAKRWAQKIKVRDAVVFGYKSKKAPIFWTILAREKDRILLLANDRLAEREFDPKKNGHWEDCELRRWMNSRLIKELFTKTEQKLIATVRNTNPGSLKYDTPRGNDTEDRLFLLSAEEVERYFATYDTGTARYGTVVTDPLAKLGTADHLSRKPGYGYLSGNNIYDWLLRTPGAKLEGYSCCMSKYQRIDSHSPAWSDNIRPALWIDLNV